MPPADWGMFMLCLPCVCIHAWVCACACVWREDSSPSDQRGIPPSSPGPWLRQCSQPRRTQLLPDGTPAPWFFQPLEQGDDWGRGLGAQVKQKEMRLSPTWCSSWPPSWSTLSGILGDALFHCHPPSRSRPDPRPEVREGSCARAGLVPEATPCTTPSRVLLPAGTKRSTHQDSELREQSLWQAWWLWSGQRDPVSSGHPGPITNPTDAPPIAALSPPHLLPEDFEFSLSSPSPPAPPPPERISMPSGGMLPGSQHSSKHIPLPLSLGEQVRWEWGWSGGCVSVVVVCIWKGSSGALDA